MHKPDAGFHDLKKFLLSSVIATLCCYSALLAAQTAVPAPVQAPVQTAAPAPKPLPEIPSLMQAVEAHQKLSEKLMNNYIYISDTTTVVLDGDGHPKHTQNSQSEISFYDGIRVQRLLIKDGKPLTGDEQKKEQEKIDKDIAKIKEKRASGNEKKKEEVSFARFLELGSFSNERRVTLHGRDTIALDYTGDPKAKTHTQFEGAIRELAGTVWVDEQDQVISRVEGHFLNNFKLAGGLFVNIAKGTSFHSDFTRINDEVWFPSTFGGEGSMRVFLFANFHGTLSGKNSNYRKFKTGSTIIPGIQEVDPSPTTPQ